MIDNNPASATFNSYGDVAGLLAFASGRGYDVPEDAAEALLLQAVDYLDLHSWAGQPTDPDQPLAWPRKGVVVARRVLPDSSIPKQLITAQYRLAIAAQDMELMPGYGGAQAIEETVSGAVSVKYSESTIGSDVSFPWLRMTLQGLLGGAASSVAFQVMRG